MKKENTFFGRLFGSRNKPTATTSIKTVTITSSSQPHVLQQRMKEEKLTHGETITAHLSPVRLESTRDKMILYFCPMKSIEVLNKIQDGDGGSIPALAKVEGLTVPSGLKEGYYTLKNVTLTSNGTMQVKATEQTVWEETEYDPF